MRKIGIFRALWEYVEKKKARLIKTGFFMGFYYDFKSKNPLSWGFLVIKNASFSEKRSAFKIIISVPAVQKPGQLSAAG